MDLAEVEGPIMKVGGCKEGEWAVWLGRGVLMGSELMAVMVIDRSEITQACLLNVVRATEMRSSLVARAAD